ncbi:SDR family oxidoreductase [Thauera sp.]|jgi:short-subunit dehydrogenase|uniref:SDR family oxidoreductase n=1 Tax=Thauera sp. TaxID=1905334 RepID=UPI0026106DD9|nr:SDR family oxidoreductase [Thauera sp.]
MELQSCRVLVTGASGGIGQALVEQLCLAGAQVLAVSRDAAGLSAAIARFPGALRHVAADLASPAGADAVAAAARACGGVECVIHGAGVNCFDLLEQQDDAAVSAQVVLNLVAPVQLTRRLLPLLRAQPRALILFVGSTFGAIGYPGFSVYSASKFGLRGFAEALRRELADSAIGVLYVAPRATRTAMNAAAVDAMNVALGVAMDPPQEVAAAIVAALRDERPERHLGWPERFFVGLNRLLPRLVDRALRRQLSTVKHFTRSNLEESRP